MHKNSEQYTYKVNNDNNEYLINSKDCLLIGGNSHFFNTIRMVALSTDAQE